MFRLWIFSFWLIHKSMDHTDPNTKQLHLMLILRVEVLSYVCLLITHLYYAFTLFGVFKGIKWLYWLTMQKNLSIINY